MAFQESIFQQFILKHSGDREDRVSPWDFFWGGLNWPLLSSEHFIFFNLWRYEFVKTDKTIAIDIYTIT